MLITSRLDLDGSDVSSDEDTQGASSVDDDDDLNDDVEVVDSDVDDNVRESSKFSNYY
jgi:hypothetical protein